MIDDRKVKLSMAAIIRSERLSRGLQQDELAAAAGISRVVLSNMERGKSITWPNLRALAKALGTTTGTMVDQAEAMARVMSDDDDDKESERRNAA